MFNLNETPSNFGYRIGIRGDGDLMPCPIDCSSKGQCIQGNCQCHEKFMGSSCEFAPKILELNEDNKITILKNQMYFFAVEEKLSKISNSSLNSH